MFLETSYRSQLYLVSQDRTNERSNLGRLDGVLTSPAVAPTSAKQCEPFRLVLSRSEALDSSDSRLRWTGLALLTEPLDASESRRILLAASFLSRCRVLIPPRCRFAAAIVGSLVVTMSSFLTPCCVAYGACIDAQTLYPGIPFVDAKRSRHVWRKKGVAKYTETNKQL